MAAPGTYASAPSFGRRPAVTRWHLLVAASKHLTTTMLNKGEPFHDR